VEWIGRAVQQAPKAEYILSLATVLEQQGRLEDARRHYSQALTLKPEDAGLWNHMGNLLWELGHKDEAAQQGWIKFGEPSFKASLKTPVRRSIQPQAGRLVLFPSYMWHGTIPFHDAAARTTIAFDVVPKD